MLQGDGDLVGDRLKQCDIILAQSISHVLLHVQHAQHLSADCDRHRDLGFRLRQEWVGQPVHIL